MNFPFAYLNARFAAEAFPPLTSQRKDLSISPFFSKYSSICGVSSSEPSSTTIISIFL